MLLITVTGAGDAAGQQGRLHKTRTIYPPAAVATPKVGRAQKQGSDICRVIGNRPNRGKMDQRYETQCRLCEFACLCLHLHLAAMAQAAQVGGFEISPLIGMGRRRGHQVAGGCRRAKTVRRHMAAIAVLFRLNIAPALIIVQNGHRITIKQLSVPGACGAAAQVRHRLCDPRGVAARDHSRIRRLAWIGHRFSSGPSAACRARVACPTPPLGRAGAALGCQP